MFTREGKKCLILFFLALLPTACLSACSAPSEYVYKLYPGPQLPPEKIAVVGIDSVGSARIDGLLAKSGDWGAVSLLPGKHTIEWGKEFGVSVMIEPSGFASGSRIGQVDLEAGHQYTLKADRTTGAGYRMFFWIVDDTTGKIVAGTRKP